MLPTALLGALLLVPGMPLALVVGRPHRRWSGVAVDALLLGFAWYLLVALVEVTLDWYGRAQVMIPTLVLVAALAPWAWRAAREVDRPQATWFSGVMAVLVVVATALRADPFYFVYQISDFGEYINGANALAEGDPVTQWFTPGFRVALSLSNLALGEAHTVDVIPLLGIVLLVATVALAERLGASTTARLVVAVIVAVGAVPVWFSRFPASESLYAVLQLGMVLLVVEAVQRRSHQLAAAAGVLAGLLLVVRGNGLLLGPIVVAVLLIAAFVVLPRTLAILSTFTVTALGSLAAAFVFNARFSFPYFIRFQLPRYVPDLVFDQLHGMGGLRFAAPRLVALALVSAALVWSARAICERFGPTNASLAWLRRLVLPAIVVVFLGALVTVLDTAGLRDALGRYAVVVEVLGAVGLAVALWRFADRMEDDERVGVVHVVLVGGTFALLFAHRLPTPRFAPYHLYWDRYLFSELFPLMVLAAIWAVWLLERWRVPTVALWVGVVVLGGVLHADGALAREQRFLGDAYGEMSDLHALVDEDLPIVFVGIPPEEVPKALDFPNTHRVLALPLAETFDERFLNIQVPPFSFDPRPTVDEIATLLDEHDVDEALVLQVGGTGGEPHPLDVGDALEIEEVGRTRVDIPMLDRPLEGSPARWRVSTLHVLVSAVSR
ncbi:MAG TPA: hypothetical protein VEA78_02330 [Acidimicrobiales bacterium]|nr:hypothetical protein [Acidimicrobiales bacterium]